MHSEGLYRKSLSGTVTGGRIRQNTQTDRTSERLIANPKPKVKEEMMTGGLLVYKCRMCGKLEKTLHVPGVVMAVVNIIHDIPQPKKWGGFNPGITSIHACGDGITGVSDLIGGEEDKPTA